MKNVNVQICFGTHCTMMGAMDIMEAVNEMKAELQPADVIRVEVVKCLDCKNPQNAPIVLINGLRMMAATTEKVMAEIMKEVEA